MINKLFYLFIYIFWNNVFIYLMLMIDLLGQRHVGAFIKKPVGKDRMKYQYSIQSHHDKVYSLTL